MKKWQCIVCGWVYDEALGDAEHGLAPGTLWADVPDSFTSSATAPQSAGRA